MLTAYTILAEEKLNKLLLRFNVSFMESKAIEIWEIIKPFSHIKIKPDIREHYIEIKDEFIFECSLSNDGNYYLILTRIINVIDSSNHIFVKCKKQYFHFIFVYKPISKYKDFKGQIYSEDDRSLNHFFTSIESKEVFKEYVYLSEPIKIYYSINDQQVTNFG